MMAKKLPSSETKDCRVQSYKRTA